MRVQSEADLGEHECADRWQELRSLGFDGLREASIAILHVAHYGLKHRHAAFAAPYLEQHLRDLEHAVDAAASVKIWYDKTSELLQRLSKL
ncbi:MAG TPA: hypothetical protein VN947_23070 [Polyangia bacterium]|nr:hypothetical protein [Polyangia bacterium]